MKSGGGSGGTLLCFFFVVAGSGVITGDSFVGGGVDTLGSGSTLGGGTVMDGVGIVALLGMFVIVGRSSAVLKIVASSRSAFRVESPAVNVGVVVEGGAVRIAIMSVAACFKKSSMCISGN